MEGEEERKVEEERKSRVGEDKISRGQVDRTK